MAEVQFAAEASTLRLFAPARCLLRWGHNVRSYMRGRTIAGTRKRGLGVGFGPDPPAAAAKNATHKRAHAAHTVRHQAVRAQSGSQFQGGVLKGPLYNGQDYLGDDPDPNIRSHILIRDKEPLRRPGLNQD